MPRPTTSPRLSRPGAVIRVARVVGVVLACLATILIAGPACAKVNPCMTPDPGWGVYDRWTRDISIGQMTAPGRGGLTKSGGFDLIVHFHGHYPIRKEFVKTATGQVLVAIDLGIGSGAYAKTFSSPFVFKKLLASIEAAMAKKHGRKKTHVRKLALSSWSAGYGAVAQILRQPIAKKVDAVILLDSAHANWVNEAAGTIRPDQVKPFLDYARKASRGSRFMFQSHSSIDPPGYAPTRAVTHYIVKKLGGKMRKAKRDDVLGLKMYERFDRSKYHVRGYRGNDKPDHCGHLGLMRDVLKVHIGPRWRSPKGRKAKKTDAAKSATKKRAALKGNIHVVKSGEHLTGIARKYGVKVKAIRDANDLSRGKPLQIGQELIIPGAKKAAAAKKAGERLKPGEKRYTVKSGDALIPIARKFGVTVPQIRERNGLRKGRPIRVGQKLIIPKKKR